MKNMVNKAKMHGKKIIIHLKRHHRKYLYGFMGTTILALVGLFTVSTINKIFANEEDSLILTRENIDKLCNMENIDNGFISCTGKDIEGIEDGAFSSYLDRIKNIDLSNNKISFINKGAFYGLSLDTLNLSYNNLGKLNYSAFEGIIWLKDLNLSFNQIFDLELHIIDGLNTIDLKENCLSDDKINVLIDELHGIEHLEGFESQIACFYVSYNPNLLTNQNVLATITLTGKGDFLGDFSDKDKIEFDNTGTKYFDVVEIVDKSGLIINYPENHQFPATVTWIDKDAPICNVTYSTTGKTTGNVVASLTGCSETIIGTNMQYTFTGNGIYTFNFQDLAGNTGNTTANVTWIDKNKPTCDVKYSTTGWTNQNVIATLTGCNKTGITVLEPNGSWTYPFTNNGSITFTFNDDYGNTGSTDASVNRIDKDKPRCSIYYETQGETGHESTTARLTGCNDEITITNNNGNRYYVLGYSGSFTFEFKDKANNTGIAVASINMPKYTIQIKNGNEMLSLYNEHKAISCEYNYRSGTYSEQILMFAKNGKIYEYSAFSDYDDNNEYGTFYTKVLVKDNKIYGWGTLFGSGIGIYADYEDFDMKDVFDDLYKNLDTGEIFLCSTGVEDTSIFSVPNNITFYDQEHYSPYSIFFSIGIDDTIKVGEYTDFTVKATKDGQIIRDYTGTIYFLLKDEDGDYVSSDYYELPENGFYEFVESDYGKKTFKHGLKIKKSGTYVLEIYSIDGTMGMGSETIVVKGNGGSNDFEYDRWSFNPNYSDEMNEAYQYARYYDITTKDSIAEANMSDGLKRIAMAKMLANYAENVLGIDDFDTSRNCKFSDVSTSLDRQYDYGVTKACQLGIMGINTPGNKFYPNGGVTRAEFATALSRLLYGTKDGTDVYYSTHIRKLWIEGIITKTDPNLREKRGYVMLMLMRAMETYDD